MLATASGLGGTWSSTGLGFLDSNGIFFGYDGSYKSLNLILRKKALVKQLIMFRRFLLQGKKAEASLRDHTTALWLRMQ